MTQRIIIWDNDGTITRSKNPHDSGTTARTILPNVERIMRLPHTINIICSGCKTPESELQNFDKKGPKLRALMEILPIAAAVFSPAIGGVECCVLMRNKHEGTIDLWQAHEEARYHHLIGQFKKPGIGMFVVIKDLLREEFGYQLDDTLEIIMIGDTWHDQAGAQAAGISFIPAQVIHALPEKYEMNDDHIFQSLVTQNKKVNMYVQQ